MSSSNNSFVISDDKQRSVLVRFDEEWEEYLVELFVNGVKNEEATYHTDDLEDAVGTAKQMVK